MKQDHLLLQDFITVSAVFCADVSIDTLLDDNWLDNELNSLTYTFKATASMGLAVGDLAVAHARDKLAIVAITDVHDVPQIDPNANFDYKWLIQKIDLTDYKNNLAQDQAYKVLMARLALVERKKALSERLSQAAQSDELLKQMYQKMITS